jgi:hypothetical protein
VVPAEAREILSGGCENGRRSIDAGSIRIVAGFTNGKENAVQREEAILVVVFARRARPILTKSASSAGERSRDDFEKYAFWLTPRRGSGSGTARESLTGRTDPAKEAVWVDLHPPQI